MTTLEQEKKPRKPKVFLGQHETLSLAESIAELQEAKIHQKQSRIPKKDPQVKPEKKNAVAKPSSRSKVKDKKAILAAEHSAKVHRKRVERKERERPAPETAASAPSATKKETKKRVAFA